MMGVWSLLGVGGAALVLGAVHALRATTNTLRFAVLLLFAQVLEWVLGSFVVLRSVAMLTREDKATVLAAWISEAMSWSLLPLGGLILVVIGEVRRRRKGAT